MSCGGRVGQRVFKPFLVSSPARAAVAGAVEAAPVSVGSSLDVLSGSDGCWLPFDFLRLKRPRRPFFT